MGTHLKLDIRTSYFPSTPISDMKFCGNRKENENTPAYTAKIAVYAGVKFKKSFVILRQRIFIFFPISTKLHLTNWG